MNESSSTEARARKAAVQEFGLESEDDLNPTCIPSHQAFLTAYHIAATQEVQRERIAAVRQFAHRVTGGMTMSDTDIVTESRTVFASMFPGEKL